MKNEFEPTHVVFVKRHDKTETTYLLACDGVPGPAYTEDEWNCCGAADWCFEDDGSLLFRGQVPICDEYWFEQY